MRPSYWKPVEDALINRDVPIYFVGGTLCVDYAKSKGIGINLDGRGFVFNASLKNGRVYVPKHVVAIVRDIYLQTKGKTNHFKEKVGTITDDLTIRDSNSKPIVFGSYHTRIDNN